MHDLTERMDDPVKKIFAVMLTLALLCLFSSAALAEGKAPGPGDKMPDFSVATADGSTFTLSEVLKERQLVLVNLWFASCVPCRVEFPFLQSAWEKYRDRVAVIALSPYDSPDAIRAYMKDVGITFAMGQDEPDLTGRFKPEELPASILVDRFGNIVYFDTGCILDEGVFTSLFDQFLGEDYTETKVLTGTVQSPGTRYTVFFLDKDLHGVEDCAASFCTDTSCVPVTSNAQGVAVFDGEQREYHVLLIDYPEEYTELKVGGLDDTWRAGDEGDFYTGTEGGAVIILMYKTGES